MQTNPAEKTSHHLVLPGSATSSVARIPKICVHQLTDLISLSHFKTRRIGFAKGDFL